MEILSDLSLYQRFFQQNSSYYIDKVQKFNEGKYFTFNFWAFLFGLLWFFYRKMYREALILIVVLIAEGMLEEFLRERSELEPQTVAGQLISTLIISTILGFTGNFFYIKKANRTIKRALAKHGENGIADGYLESRGGTSYVLFILVFVAIIAFFFMNNAFSR